MAVVYYNVVARPIISDISTVGDKVAAYINSLAKDKTIYDITMTVVGTDRVIVLIVHDA